ncbi:AAA family ATPase [Saprospiraceae bacterium]|nr:AAA family ATPase [Saprospiraceae bacterium]
MYFKRLIYSKLLDWKKKDLKKPLILRGARQVGKTTIVKELAQTYKNSILLNLEKVNDRSFFEQYDNVQHLKDAIFLAHNISSEQIDDTLLFIDEIQESTKAISMLRYFYEEIPNLHLIAAGSLLEFAMGEVKNFPVGRIEFLYLHPLNFSEFLQATGHDQALLELQRIPTAIHSHSILMDLFNTYTIIGGMPEIIKLYLQNKSISDLPSTYESIWTTYKSDIEKYTNNSTERKVIKHIMSVAHLYVDQRIKFEKFGNSTYSSRDISSAFKNLNDARIIQLIYPTTNVKSPIIPDIKKSPRIQFLDTGLINYDLKIQGNMLTYKDLSTAYKGKIIPHVITQELISLNTISYHKPHFWVREKKQSSAEVDLIINYKDKLIPIEIKSGSYGRLRSLHQFIDMADHPYAIRLYGGEFSVEEHVTPIKRKPFKLMNLPYYLGTQLNSYIEYFLSNY